MPTYNGEKYIHEQLESILSQLSDDDEVIISDDGSTDRTLDTVGSFGDPRIKIFKHSKIHNPYKGPSRNIYAVYRNVEHALSQAKGDYIFLSDQDDIWLPNKVQHVMQAFRSGAELILHDNKVINNRHEVLADSYFSIIKPSTNPLRIVFKCFFQGASMAFTRKVMGNSLPFPNLPVSHDHWIAYNAFFRTYELRFLSEKLLLYRRHGENVSPSTEKSANPLSFKLMYRIHLLRSIGIIGFRHLKGQ